MSVSGGFPAPGKRTHRADHLPLRHVTAQDADDAIRALEEQQEIDELDARRRDRVREFWPVEAA